VQFIAALNADLLHPISELSEGFVHPRFPDEIEFSYYQASLFCEMVESQKGAKALPAMLTAYRDGLGTPEVFQRVLGATTAQVDSQFARWMRAKFAVPLRSITAERTISGSKSVSVAGGSRPETAGLITPKGAFVEAMNSAVEAMEKRQVDSTRVRLERAQALFPEYAGDDSPAWMLARLARDRGDTATALSQLTIVTSRNETAWEPNRMEADLRERRGDAPGAMAALSRMLWISPYDNTVHDRLATLAAARGDYALALRERRAVVTNQPTDVMMARYELARSLAATGDVTAARRELLQVLEQAPSFEKAQALLLELRKKPQDDPNGMHPMPRSEKP
jgi:tetratricopeptide (TPR) repeat protein